MVKSAKNLFRALFISAFIIFLLSPELNAQGSGSGRRMITFTQFLLFPRFWLSVLIGLGGGVLLVTLKIRRTIRAILLSGVFILFGVLPHFHEIEFFAKLAPHPSPLCSFAKPVMFSLQAKQFVLPPVFAGVLAFIVFLSIVGNKLFCGWVCPIGALQEVCYLLPIVRQKKRLSYFAVNTIRYGLLVFFVPALVHFGIYLYGYFNPFEILHWRVGTEFWILYTWIVIAITITVSLFTFRPFCHIVCPIGALTWLLEHISVARIRLLKDRCNQCGLCVKKSPCMAVNAILAGKRVRPDCYACGKCIEVCPENAVAFNIK